MSEITIKMRIAQELYEGAVELARFCGLTPERYIAEIIEAHMADHRLKEVKGVVHQDR